MVKHLKEYPKLIFTEDVLISLKHKSFTPEATSKLLDALKRLDLYGTNPDMLGKKLENTGRHGLWTIRIKDRTNQWRVIFKKIKGDYFGIVLIFKKTEPKINNRFINNAISICNREGW